ncbi:hypothetical protein [Marinobacter sp. CA1]|uniref:hypothetical protein n=1 Tax=Marinobacter sp. CA1 TaxID=2817656 RepID=UPI001D07AABC|nr:hypothetical protein [Marinobacter sp. CA1]MCG8520124.1 hypothetical protein [Pseudomonadales bacterium]UDL05801.1 hypothetical protein J2887_03270 [Marinobacter sp. CA1]
MASQSVLVERGLLRVVARKLGAGEVSFSNEGVAYDVEIDGQEVLKTFLSFGEAVQFLDMVSPSETS